jgi:hypothetical protein
VSTDERALGTALARYAEDAGTTRDMYAGVLRWHRRRRRRRVAGTALGLAAALAAGTIVATTRTPEKLVAIPAAPPPNTYTHPNGVRGSLGGNVRLLNEASRAALAQMRVFKDHPDHLTPIFAERSGDTVVVLFEGTSAVRPTAQYGVSAVQKGGGKWKAAGSSLTIPADQAAGQRATDIEVAQKFYGPDPLWVDWLGGDGVAAVIVPPDLRAEALRGAVVAADGSVRPNWVPLKLNAGTALVPIKTIGQIRFRRAGRIISTTKVTQGVVSNPRLPSNQEIEAAAPHARGHVDVKVAKDTAGISLYGLGSVGDPNWHYRVIWGGKTIGRTCVLFAAQYASGAMFPMLGCTEPGGIGSSTVGGTVPASAFDRIPIAWQNGRSTPLIMAPPGAVRATILYANQHTEDVPLDNGFGHAKKNYIAKSVRLYDAGGTLISEFAINANVHRVS